MRENREHFISWPVNETQKVKIKQTAGQIKKQLVSSEVVLVQTPTMFSRKVLISNIKALNVKKVVEVG